MTESLNLSTKPEQARNAPVPRYPRRAQSRLPIRLWDRGPPIPARISVWHTRPIYHQTDQAIRGHVFCSFLALVLRQELERRVEDHGWTLEWADIIRDLDQLDETTITVDDTAYVIRSEIKGTLGKVFHAPGVVIPPALRPV